MKIRRSRGITLGVAAAAAVAVTTGLAWAAIPGGDGTIQGCYTKVGGVLRVVDSASQCKSFEVATPGTRRA